MEYEKVDVWFKSQLKSGADIGFGCLTKSRITDMMKYHIGSYIDLPRVVHQFQITSKWSSSKKWHHASRRVIMKDMYSYSLNETEHMDFV